MPDQVGRAGAAQHKQLVLRPAAQALLRKVLQRSRRAIQYFEHSEGDGREMFQAVCKLAGRNCLQRRKDHKIRACLLGPVGTVGDFKSNDRCAYIGAAAITKMVAVNHRFTLCRLR
ncbi:MAG: hypothetical protein WCF38_15100 [Pseudolabrys sp.]